MEAKEFIETGVVVKYKNKFWGLIYTDNHSTTYGWVDINEAIITNPKYLTKPEDLTYKNSPHTKELKKGKLVPVKRITKVIHIFE